MNWVDHARGVALVITMFLHLMRWLLHSFAGWDFTQSSLVNPEIALIRFMEGYLRIGWISAFALSFVISYNPKHQSINWICKRFALLIILPTAVFGWFSYLDVGQFNLRWEVIQSLFIYNIISLWIITQSQIVRYLSYLVMLIISFVGFKYMPELVNHNLLGDILFGNLEQNNYFSVVSGLVAYFYIFEICLISYNPQDKTLKSSALVKTLIFNIVCFLILGFSGFNSWEPRHYPPQLIEYFGGFIVSNLIILSSYKLRNWMTEYNLVALLGRYCWIHFLGHLAIGSFLFDVLGIGKNSFNFWQASTISIGVLLSLWGLNVLVLYTKKHKGGS